MNVHHFHDAHIEYWPTQRERERQREKGERVYQSEWESQPAMRKMGMFTRLVKAFDEREVIGESDKGEHEASSACV